MRRTEERRGRKLPLLLGGRSCRGSCGASQHLRQALESEPSEETESGKERADMERL